MISNGIGTTPGDDVTFTTLGGQRRRPAAGPGKKGTKKFCKVPKVVGKKLNPARRKVLAAGCKAKVVYKFSKRPKGIVLKQSRKAKKKLVYRAVVKLTVAKKPIAQAEAKTVTKKKSSSKAYVATSELRGGRGQAACTVRKTAEEARLSTPAPDPILLCYDRSAGARRAIETAGGALPRPQGDRPSRVESDRPLAAAAYGSIAPIADLRRERARAGRCRALAEEGAEPWPRWPGSMPRRRSSESHATREPGTRSSTRRTTHGAGLVVLGARGLSTFQSLLLGSVSHGVAQHARVPVLIVPPATA